MSSKAYTLIAHTPGSSQPVRHNFAATQDPLKALRVKVVPGARYELVDNATGFAPQQLQVKRIGKNLLMGIDLDKPEQTSLILEDYYTQPGALVTGLAESGQIYPFIPDTANPAHAIGQLTDGTQITQVLGGSALAPFAAGAVAATTGAAAAVAAPLALSPGLLAAIGLGALALGAGGGGGGGGGGGVTPPTPSVTIETLATDGRINKDEATAARITGSSNQPNTTLTVSATDGVHPPVTRQVTTDANGRWTADMDLGTLNDGNIRFTATVGNTSHTLDGSKDTQAPQPTTDPAADVQPGQFNAQLAPDADSGAPGDSKTNNTRPTLTGKGDPGDTIQVMFSPTETKTVTVGPDGTWRLAPDTGLPPGRHTLQIKAIDLSGNASEPVELTLDIDTTALGLAITHNFNDLNTNPAQGAQPVLNLAESQTGVTYTITFDAVPHTAAGAAASLLEDQLTVAGGSIKAGSFVKVSDTQYTVVLLPNPGTDAGSLSLGVAANAFFTVAGNPNAAASAASVPYDTQAPTPTVFLGQHAFPSDPAIYRLDATTIAALVQDWPLGAQLPGQDNTANVRLLFNDDTLQPSAGSVNGLYSFPLSKTQLEALPDGLYTLRYEATDTAGNTGMAQHVIDVTSAPAYAAPLQSANGTTANGTVASERFLNTAGNQTFTGGGGNDSYFWLLRDKGTPGAPDVDTITDFAIGDPETTAHGDRLNFVDLIWQADAAKPLEAFVQLQAYDTPGSTPGNDSTRLLISHNGQFATDGSNATSVADQVIILQGVNTTLTELTNNQQLITAWPLP